VAKDETVLEMIGDYLRELSVLVLVFFPLELSKGGQLSKLLMWYVGAFSIGAFLLGVLFAKWLILKSYVKRFLSAMEREFGNHE
jgi:hypothetical protein